MGAGARILARTMTPPAPRSAPKSAEGAGAHPLGRGDAALAAALAALAAAFILPGLGAQALANWDEAAYGAIAREFLRRPALTLYYNGAPFFEKPPLVFWAMALVSRLLGVDEFALRLPSALAGIAAVVLTFLAGRRLAGRAAGAIAALLLLGVPQFVAWSRLAMLDVPLLTFGVLAVVLVIHAGERGRWLMAAAGAAFGLAVMTKFVAAGLFVPGLLALIVARRGARSLLSRDVIRAAFVALLVSLPWHLEQAFAYGRPFVDSYVMWNVLERLSQPLDQHTGGALYYLKIYRYNAGLLAPVHAAGVLLAIGLAVWRRERMLGALVVLALGTFCVVNASATKIGWYLTPVYACAALCAGTALACALRSARAQAAACFVALALVVPGALEGRGRFVEDYNVMDFSDDVRLLAGQAPFGSRVPKLHVYVVSVPAPLFYLADLVEQVDAEQFERLAVSTAPGLCLSFRGDAEELIGRHPEGQIEILARTPSLAVIGRRPPAR